MNIEIRGESKSSVDALKINLDQAILDISRKNLDLEIEPLFLALFEMIIVCIRT